MSQGSNEREVEKKKREKRVAFRNELNERVRRRKGGFRGSKRRVEMLKERKTEFSLKNPRNNETKVEKKDGMSETDWQEG